MWELYDFRYLTRIPQYPFGTHHFWVFSVIRFLKTHRYRFAPECPLLSVFAPRRSVFQSRLHRPNQHSEILLAKYIPLLISESPFVKNTEIRPVRCVFDVSVPPPFKRFTLLTSACFPVKYEKPVCSRNNSCFLPGDLVVPIFGKAFSPPKNTDRFHHRKGMRDGRRIENRARSCNSRNPHRYPQSRSQNCLRFPR